MSRSRSFNRFHRQLARQRRHDLRHLIPRFRNGNSSTDQPVDEQQTLIDRQSRREISIELLECEI